MPLQEITYNHPKPEYTPLPCPNCQQKKLVSSTIPCPDGRIGCCVAHYGYICDNCGKVYSGSLK